ncbi:MAG TPA: hypothetical protein ENN44_00875 [Methanoculleus sp.]|nr:hypothetical protein [Methanoculleus sp.]
MTVVRKSMTAGVIVYLLIAVWQVALRPGVVAEAAFLLVGLAALGGIVWAENEPVLKKAEMALLWVCIALFVFYAALTAGGVV